MINKLTNNNNDHSLVDHQSSGLSQSNNKSEGIFICMGLWHYLTQKEFQNSILILVMRNVIVQLVAEILKRYLSSEAPQMQRVLHRLNITFRWGHRSIDFIKQANQFAVSCRFITSNDLD